MSNEAENFKEDVTNIINYGKYSAQVVGQPPTWTARNGEFVFFSSSSIKRIYFYNNNSWDFFQYENGGTLNQIRTWITFSGTGLLEIIDSFNITALTRTALGQFEATIDTDYSNIGYVRAGMSWKNNRILFYKSNSLGSLDITVTKVDDTVVDPDSAGVLSTGDVP